MNPVWPKLVGPNSPPRGVLWPVWTSQPRPRRWSGGVAPASIIARTASGERMRRPFGPTPPSSIVWAIDGQVVGRGEQPRVAGDAAQGPRPRVVDDAAEHPAPSRLRLGRGDPLDRDGEAAPCPVDRPEMGVRHAEQVEDSLAGELVERLAR